MRGPPPDTSPPPSGPAPHRHVTSGGARRWVMGKRAPRLPAASAERIKVTISDCDWQRIERAYGQKLSPEARRDIHEKTQEYVDRAEFEQNAEPVSDARDRTNAIIIKAAGSLRSALDGGDRDADVYARTLIKKHLWKQSDAEKQKEGDAIEMSLALALKFAR